MIPGEPSVSRVILVGELLLLVMIKPWAFLLEAHSLHGVRRNLRLHAMHACTE